MFRIGDNSIQFVSEFKYLGHLLNNRMTDDDIQREVKKHVYSHECADATLWSLFCISEIEFIQVLLYVFL